MAHADPTVTKEFGEPQAPPAASHFTALVADNVALVRTDWVRVCEQIGGVLGVEWLVEQIVPVVLRQADEKNYQARPSPPPSSPSDPWHPLPTLGPLP